MTIHERLSERFERQRNLGAERRVARKEELIDHFGVGGQKLTEAEEAEMYEAMQNDPSGTADLMQSAVRRAQRPYKSFRGTAIIPIPFLEWDAREWKKRQDRALKDQAAEQPLEEGED